MLVHLTFVLVMLGSALGLTPEQTAGKYVYYSDRDIGLSGVACRDDFRTIPGNRQDLCPADVPSGTAVLFPTAWQGGWYRMAHVLRHEVEHLIRGADGPAHDPFNEVAATRAACQVQWDWGYCSVAP